MKVFTIIAGVLLVIVGVFCLFTPGLTFLSIGWLLGLMLVIAAISVLVDYIALRKFGVFSGLDLFLAIITGILGVVLLINQPARFLTEMLAVYLLGVWMLVGGVIRIVEAIRVRKVAGSMWGLGLVVGILMVGLGVYSFFHPMVSAIAVALLIGFYILLAGADLIAFGASMKKTTDASGEEHWTIAG